MKLYLPDNIFSRLLYHNLPETLKQKTEFLPSALIAKRLSEENESAGFIPCLDIINFKDMKISKSFGIAFEGDLSNSFIYYNKLNRSVDEISLLGDVSIQEVLLSKMFFKEIYDITVSINIMTTEGSLEDKNVVAIGNYNYKNDNYMTGLSFASEIEDLVGNTYVNYILAGMSETILNDMHLALKGIESKVYDYVFEESDFMKETGMAEVIKDNINSVIYEFNEADINAFEQLLQLPFMHSLIPEIPEVKYFG